MTPRNRTSQEPPKAPVATVDRGLAREQRLREVIFTAFTAILKGDNPSHLKCFVVVLLFICASVSVVLVLFFGELLLVVTRAKQTIDATVYAAIVAGHCAVGVAFGVPVTIRLAQIEEATRLEGSLNQVKNRRNLPTKRRTIAPYEADND